MHRLGLPHPRTARKVHYCDTHERRHIRPGEPDGGEECPDDCDHPPCPMCEIEWERHQCKHTPLWRRWLTGGRS